MGVDNIKFWCEACGGMTYDDIRGNCSACGAPREIDAVSVWTEPPKVEAPSYHVLALDETSPAGPTGFFLCDTGPITTDVSANMILSKEWEDRYHTGG